MGKSQLINQYSFNLDLTKMSSNLQNLWEKKVPCIIYFLIIFFACVSQPPIWKLVPWILIISCLWQTP